MVFLATPHKGTDFGETLNMILKMMPGGCPKHYIAELEKNSASLNDINEQFRNVCCDLKLVSFHETRETKVAPATKRIIVRRDSAQLDYPGEITSSLTADHHGVSKFESIHDPNYGSVRNVLRWLMKETLNDTRLSPGTSLCS
jgi:hypothetical protein